MPAFAAGEIGQGPHDPDMACIPDFSSLQIVPWRPEIAWVAGNIHVNEQQWPYCPRTILQRQLDKVRQQGYTFNTGTEAEFMLLKQDEHGAYAPWDALDTLGKPCYDLRALHRNLDIITTIVTYMQELGWGPYAADHEDATCQFELNWLYGDGATTPDRHTFFKWMVKTVAEQHGLLATFMPKPFAHLTGNGAHHHISLWDADNRDQPVRGRLRRQRPLPAGLLVYGRRPPPRARPSPPSPAPSSTATSASSAAPPAPAPPGRPSTSPMAAPTAPR